MDQSKYSIIEQFQIVTVNCKQPLHDGEEIKALCLRQECNHPSALCFICKIELHQDCKQSLKTFNEITQLVKPFLQILSKLEFYQQHKNLSLWTQQQIFKMIDTLKPLNLYQLENQGLQNLNLLGALLKSQKYDSIQEQLKTVEDEIKFQYKTDKQNKGNLPLNQLQKQQKAIDSIDAQSINRESLNQSQRYQEAIESCDILIKINPSEEVYFLKGSLLMKLQKYQEAIDSCDQAIKIDPSCINAWKSKGLSLIQLQRYQEAIVSCDQAIKINPSWIEIWNLKGQSLIELQKYEEAIYCIDQTLKINPNDDFAKRMQKVIKAQLDK